MELTTAVVAFLVTASGIYALTPISHFIGLTDSPSLRKKHDGVIPLIGGIGIYLAVTASAFVLLPVTDELLYLLVAAGLLVFTGAIDDKYGLSFKFRLMIHCFAGLIVALGIDNQLHSVGNLLGLGEIELGVLKIPLTVLAIAGLINAFNMIDGLDGLAGGLALIAFGTLYLLTASEVSDSTRLILTLFIGALSAYLLFNLHLFPRHSPKIFLGDAGSTLLGFAIATFLIRYSQEQKQVLEPVTALWVVAVPLMDMATTFLRRLHKGHSPFYPDRTHVHHIFIRAGFTKEATLLIILGTSVVLAAIGVAFSTFDVATRWSSAAFLLTFLIYLQFVGHAFKFSQFLDRKKILASS